MQPDVYLCLLDMYHQVRIAGRPTLTKRHGFRLRSSNNSSLANRGGQPVLSTYFKKRRGTPAHPSNLQRGTGDEAGGKASEVDQRKCKGRGKPGQRQGLSKAKAKPAARIQGDREDAGSILDKLEAGQLEQGDRSNERCDPSSSQDGPSSRRRAEPESCGEGVRADNGGARWRNTPDDVRSGTGVESCERERGGLFESEDDNVLGPRSGMDGAHGQGLGTTSQGRGNQAWNCSTRQQPGVGMVVPSLGRGGQEDDSGPQKGRSETHCFPGMAKGAAAANCFDPESVAIPQHSATSGILSRGDGNLPFDAGAQGSVYGPSPQAADSDVRAGLHEGGCFQASASAHGETASGEDHRGTLSSSSPWLPQATAATQEPAGSQQPRSGHGVASRNLS